jgi:hypothetical protein
MLLFVLVNEFGRLHLEMGCFAREGSSRLGVLSVHMLPMAGGGFSFE